MAAKPARMAARSAARAAAIERALRAIGTRERAAQEKRYLKSELAHLGASVPAMRRAVGAALRRAPIADRSTLLAEVRALWRRPVHECRAAAVELLERHVGLLGPRDLPLLLRLIREARTWALVDGLAPCVVGPLLEAHPEKAAVLTAWGRDPDFWVRRAALLAHLLPLRRGQGDFAAFAALAEPMLSEQEFFIRKAIGWVLREASKKRPDRVYAWLLPRAARVSGLTLREASRYLSAGQRARLAGAVRGVTRASRPRARARWRGSPRSGRAPRG